MTGRTGRDKNDLNNVYYDDAKNSRGGGKSYLSFLYVFCAELKITIRINGNNDDRNFSPLIVSNINCSCNIENVHFYRSLP